MEIELAYYDVTVEYVSHYATRSSQQKLKEQKNKKQKRNKKIAEPKNDLNLLKSTSQVSE